MYRKDVLEGVCYKMSTNEEEKIRPNFAALARTYGCDYRTVKAAYDKRAAGQAEAPKRPPKPSKLDPFKETIIQKLAMPCKVSAIYYFIRKNGYTGKETILKAFCRKYRDQMNRIATMRFETEPGFQAQIDWKEEMTLVDRHGNRHVFNIFLMVMGFSRMKYVELTIDRNQDTLMSCIINAVRYFGGSPAEVLFDNMKTVADVSRSEFGAGAINERFYSFARDALFCPRLCRAFRPQTKGKAEDLAKLTERLRPFNNEFEGLEDLERIVFDFANDLNSEVSQATGMKPFSLHEKEKPLLRMPDLSLLAETYIDRPIQRKVSRESMVTFQGRKYSVNPRYIGRTLTIASDGSKISICLGSKLVASHAITGRRMNYTKDDYVAIMKSGAFKGKPDDMIDAIADKNLNIYDLII